MKSVVFTFGRMNPPTTGHQLLVNKLVTFARTNKSVPRVYLSHSVGKKDPLSYDKKLSFARAAFGPIVRKSNSKNVIQILKDLEKEGFTQVTMFAGSDRVPEFTKLLNNYNGKEYTFEKITVKSAGERDPDADDVSGMSASKMRALAKGDKAAEFLRGAPNTLKSAQAKNMFNAVRKALLGEDVMEYGHDERFLEFILESEMKDDLSDLPSDGEIAKHFDSLGADDLDLDDADAMMLDIILDREEDKEEIDEAKVLNFQQRQKLSQRMKSMSKRLARLRQIKAKQMPAQQRLRMRSRKAALMILRKRATGKKNLEYSTLSRSQRIAVDTALVQRFGKNLNTLVGRLATRLMPRVRKHAQEYMKKAREQVKESFIYEAKEKEGSAKDVAQDKVQAAKRGMSVSDWEKTKADAAHDSPLNIDATKLNSLGIDPTKNDRAAPNPKQGHLHLNRKLSHYRHSVDEGRKSSSDKDARDAGDTNIIYQMRKIIDSRGQHETVFADKSKSEISVADAKKMLAKFEALRLPADKYEFTVQAGKSLASFKNVMAHGAKPEKKKISLGGRQFKEFYLGVGRTRTMSPGDHDEPPGVRRVAEASTGGVDPDANDDPNKSRKANQKLDLLLRLGLADGSELQKYRRALRSSKKQALQSPEMRNKLADLLDKLIDLTTGDPTTFSRVRQRVMTKEAMSLLNKAEASGIDISILGEVFARGYKNNEDINEAFNRVNSFIAGGKAAEMDKDLSEAIENKKGRIYKDGKWIGTVRHRGDSFNSHRTHPTKKLSVVKSHKTRADAEKHIIKSHEMGEAVKEPTGGLKDACWKGYTAVGMKMKNGRSVPNCVPKESSDCRCEGDCKCVKEAQRTADIKMIKVRMPDGTIKFRKEKATTSVQNEAKSVLKTHPHFTTQTTHPHPTGKVPYGSMTNKELRDALPKKVKSASESYTGSEATSSNKNDPSNRFVGTNEIRRNYASATPGQEQVAGEISVAAFSPEKQSYISPGVRQATNEVDKSKLEASQKSLKSFREALSGIRESNDLNEAFSAGFELAPLARDYGIKVQSSFEHHPEVQESLDAQEDAMNEAIYQGRTVTLNKPMQGDVKKSKVYVRDPSTGNIKKVNFGDKNLSIKKDQPARKKSYCARSSGQGNLGKKTSANYWSRRAWDC